MARVLFLFLFTKLLKCEESSILEGAVAYNREKTSVWGFDSPQALIDGAFKSPTCIKTNLPTAEVELLISLSQPKRIVSAFVVNAGHDATQKEKMETAYLYLGNDISPFASSLSKCSAVMYDTAFLEILPQCSQIVGTVSLRIWNNSKAQCMNEIRLYQTPNLLQKLQGAVKIQAS